MGVIELSKRSVREILQQNALPSEPASSEPSPATPPAPPAREPVSLLDELVASAPPPPNNDFKPGIPEPGAASDSSGALPWRKIATGAALVVGLAVFGVVAVRKLPRSTPGAAPSEPDLSNLTNVELYEMEMQRGDHDAL